MISLLDGVAALLVVASSVLALSAAVGLNRFPDLFTRIHAAAKPQTLGVVLVLIAIGVVTRDPGHVWLLIAIGAFQLMTVPVSALLVGRRAYRTLPLRPELLTEPPEDPGIESDDDADGADCDGGAGQR